MSTPKPSIPTLHNVGLPNRTRIVIDGQEGRISDHATSRQGRLVGIIDQPGIEMVSVHRISKAWLDGVEHNLTWDLSKAITPHESPKVFEGPLDSIRTAD